LSYFSVTLYYDKIIGVILWYIYIYIVRQSINGDDYLSGAARTDKKQIVCRSWHQILTVVCKSLLKITANCVFYKSEIERNHNLKGKERKGTVRNHLCLYISFKCFKWHEEGPSWSNGDWIYNYLSNQYLSPLKLWVPIRSWRGDFQQTLANYSQYLMSRPTYYSCKNVFLV
jgi:hypothetical protein